MWWCSSGVHDGEDHVDVRVELRAAGRGEVAAGVERQAVRLRAERAGRDEVGDAALVVGDALGDGAGAAVGVEHVEPDAQADAGRPSAVSSTCEVIGLMTTASPGGGG